MTEIILRGRPRSGESRILQCALKFKGLEREFIDDPNIIEPELVDQGNVIRGIAPILWYLDDRYPAPPFLIGDAVQRSRIRMILYQLIEKIRYMRDDQTLVDMIGPFEEYAENEGFMTDSDLPSIVDVSIAAVCPKEASPWKQFYDKMEAFCTQQTRAG